MFSKCSCCYGPCAATSQCTAPHIFWSICSAGKMLSHVLQGEGRDSGGHWALWLQRRKLSTIEHFGCDPPAAPEPNHLDPASVHIILIQIHMRSRGTSCFLFLFFFFCVCCIVLKRIALLFLSLHSLFEWRQAHCSSVRSQWRHFRWHVTQPPWPPKPAHPSSATSLLLVLRSSEHSFLVATVTIDCHIISI